MKTLGLQGFILLLRILSGYCVMYHLILLMLLFFKIVIFIFSLVIHFIH